MFRVVSVQCWVGALVLVALVVAPAAASEIAFDSDASTVYTGDGSATLTLERSGDTTGEVAVRMRIAGGTAQVDVDYVGRPASSDDSFDPGSGASAQLTTLAVQDDGKIVIGGTQFFNYDGVSCPRLARIMPDGSLDTTFTPDAPNNTVRAIALQADGKIVIAGNFDTVGGVTRRRVARLNANGTLDTSFDANLGLSHPVVWDVLVQSDGKIVIGHRTVTRFDSDGSLDINFDAGVGTGASHTVVALARQADGKLIAGGNFTSFSGSSLNRVVRLDTDGSIDLTFDPGTGITGSATPQVLTCLVQPDGRIVLGGTFTHYDDNPSQHLVRVESDGSWDATFVPGTILGNVQRVVRQTDGRLLLAGTFTSIGGEVRERLARLEPDGALDPAFVPSVGNAPGDMALQHDGAIMRVGTFSQVNDTFWSRIGRVHGDWYVTWGDGEGGALTVEIPLLSSGTGTSSTLEFELYDPQGGAALGSVAAHTLTIIDEDAPGDPGNEERGGCASVAHVDWGCTLLLAALTLLLVARRRLG